MRKNKKSLKKKSLKKKIFKKKSLNQKILRKTLKNKKTLKRKRKQNLKNRKKVFRGGSKIPFWNELTLLPQKITYSTGKLFDNFKNNNVGVPNNPESSRINPDPTQHYLRSSVVGSNINNTDIKSIYNQHFS